MIGGYLLTPLVTKYNPLFSMVILVGYLGTFALGIGTLVNKEIVEISSLYILIYTAVFLIGWIAGLAIYRIYSSRKTSN